MEKRYYNSTSIGEVLRVFERSYGMSSEDFYEAHLTDAEVLTGIPGSQRQAWAGFYDTWTRMRSGSRSFAEQAQRELEPA